MQLHLQKGSRLRILAMLLCGIMAIFVVRLFYLQIIRHGYYVAQAQGEQTRRSVIPAKRGEIYAMDGTAPVKLVLNEPVYTVFADPPTVSKPDAVVDTVRQVAGGNARQNLSELLAKRDTRYQILATKLTRTQAELIKKANLAGVGLQEETQRVYPEGQLAAQTLGFVNAAGDGQYGVEQQLNDRLKGTDGMLKTVADVNNVPLSIGDQNIDKPAKNGDNVVLTIDSNIQSYAEKALAAGLEKVKAPIGSVLVMDPQSGKVLAMANMPTYNPTDYSKVQDGAAFNNPIVSEPYEAGSVMKTMTVATGLDKGIITPDSTYVNTDSIKVDDRTISNATKGQTGTITIQHALNYSLNTGMVTVAERLGDGNSVNYNARKTMYDYLYNHYGFGQKTGIEVAGESKGIIISPDDQDGNAVRYANMSFGQGLDVTMIQAGAAFSSIINGGTYYHPTILGGVVDDEGVYRASSPQTPRTGVISASASGTLKQMVHDARAAFYAGSDKKGYDIGGKTGTSETIVNGTYVENQTVASYLGFGGDGTPRYVIMVEVSGPGLNLQGNRDAMPIFTDISNWMIDYLKLQPKG